MKNKFKRMLSVLLLSMFLVINPLADYHRAKAVEPISMTIAALGLTTGTVALCVVALGLGAVAIGYTVKNWDLIKFTGQRIWDNLVNKGIDPKTITDGTKVKYNQAYKDALIETTENIPTEIEVLEDGTQVILNSPIDLFAFKYYLFPVSFTISEGKTAVFKFTNVDGKLYPTDYFDIFSSYHFVNPFNKQLTSNYTKSRVVSADRTTMTMTIGFTGNYGENVVGWNAMGGQGYGAKRIEYVQGAVSRKISTAEAYKNVPISADERRSLLNRTVDTDKTITYNQTAELADATTQDLNRISTQDYAEPSQTGILSSILDAVRSLPAKLEMIINPPVPQNVTIDFTPFQAIDLTRKFPFSIPWDILSSFNAFANVGSSAPKWNLDFTKLHGGMVYTLDLSVLNPLAAIMRWGILILFNLGLILKTKNIMKG